MMPTNQETTMSKEDNEYLVTRDYHNDEFDFDLVEGDVISEKSFDKASLVMVDRLVGRGILLLIETEAVEQAEEEDEEEDE